MPVEIKELHIKMTVNASEKGSSANSGGASKGNSSSQSGNEDSIIAECVEQVLRILQQQKER